MTNLDMIIENFNGFNIPIPEKFGIPNESDCELAISLIEEELAELKAAVKAKDEMEVKDALVDIGYVLNAFIVRAGYHNMYNNDYAMVHRANMSKLCKSEEEAKRTVDAYRTGTHPHKPGVKIDCYYERTDDDAWAVFRSSDKKYLKSINWVPPQYRPVV